MARALSDAGLGRVLLAAAAGVAVMALPQGYPAAGALAGVLLLGLGGLALARRNLKRLTLPALFALGCLYGYWQMGSALAQRLPLCADATVRAFELEILQTPVLKQSVARFPGAVRISHGDDCLAPGTYRLRFSWHEPPPLAQGERWQVTGRLRPPWGNRNPGGFDYERWLLAEGLDGTGYLRDGERLAPAAQAPDARQRIRQALRRWLEDQAARHGPVLLALMTGDASSLSQADWRLLRDSGTVHLLVVSGLHVGMVGGFLYLLGRLLARVSTRLLLRFGARPLAGSFALAGSGLYVWLSGSGVPAVRAWLMSAIVLLAIIGGYRVRGLNVVLLVMAAVLLGNPLVVHQQGFWLSFAAVLALLAWFEPALNAAGVAETPDADGRLRRLARRAGQTLVAFAQVQIVLLVALSPLLAAFQGGAPLQSPLANAVVVPLVTFGVLPLALIAALLHVPLPAAAAVLLTLAERSLDLVMLAVSSAAALPTTAMSLGGPAQWLLMGLVLIGAGRRPWRWQLGLALALWWALLLPDGRLPPTSEFRVTALDVGQGSAFLVDTHQHRLIFDTGPRYESGFDLGDAVVVPSFLQLGPRRLSALVVSHDDVDHAGGAAAVIEQLRPEAVWASFHLPLAGASLRACVAGQGWQWDGVRFEFLHPTPGWRGSDNDRSCVLRISNGRRAVLLAGDVSRRVEARLPKEPVDLLMAPHHGSRTSSSPGFVRGFAPALAWVSTDRRSRYGHPHPDVLARYRAAEVAITGRQGALRWRSDRPRETFAFRARRAAYWHRRFRP